MRWFLFLCILAAAAPLARQQREDATPAPLEVTQRPGSLVRKINSATRKLHPAADCFRGAGFTGLAIRNDLASIERVVLSRRS